MKSFFERLFSGGKAQTEVVSALLIVGISLAAVSVAYTWGVPIIQKGQSTNQIRQAESVMDEIGNAIEDVAANGGQKSLSLSLQGPLEISEGENAITYTIASKKAGVARTEWVPLNEGDTFGIAGTNQNQSIPVYGTDKDGVIMARANVLGDGYSIDYKLAYRELDDLNTREGRSKVISAVGNNKASGGDIKLLITKEPQTVSASQSRLGGKLTLTNIQITVS